MNETRVVETFHDDGSVIKLRVVYPNNIIAGKINQAYHIRMAQLVKESVGAGDERLLLRTEMDKYLKESGIWGDKESADMERLGLEVRARELILRKGGMTLEQGRTIAMQMNEMRATMLELIMKRQQFDSSTMESVAENYRFDVTVVMCTLLEGNDTQYFKNRDDYLVRGDMPAAIAAAEAMAQMLYGYDAEFKRGLYEFKWLKDAKFIDDHGRLVNREGKFVDHTGMPLNVDGRYVDDKGDLVDRDGNTVDVFGEFYVSEPKPFTDADGNEVYVGQEPPKPKRKKVPKKKTAKKTKKTKKKTAAAK
jgi:hypothetical protein